MKQPKQLHIGASLVYGWRLTRKHFKTLVPGSILFYLPELLNLATGLSFGWWKSVWHSIVACLLLWHALQLSDQETYNSRPHEALPSAGYLGRFVSSTGLFWGVLMLGLWPSFRIASGTWHPTGMGPLLAWMKEPWAWSGDQSRQFIFALLVSLPAGLWSVYGWFHGYYVADEGQNAWPSMKSSFHAVRGAFVRTLLFLIVIAALNMAGYALWVVGVFLAFPVTLMATTYAHLELKDQTRA